VLVVEAMDELFDTTAILLRHPTPTAGTALGTAFITGSGAMKNLALDFADGVGLSLPTLAPATVAALRERLPAYAVAENPLDYTTIGVRQPGLIGELVQVMAADPAIASVVLCIPVGPVMAQRDKAQHIVPALAQVAKPTALVLTGDNGAVEPFFLEAIQASGVPLFRSADRALRALARLAEHGQALARALRADAASSTSTGLDTPVGAHATRDKAGDANDRMSVSPTALPWPAAVPPNGIFAEHHGKAWLKAAGVAVPRGALATTVEEAVRVAASIGYPVVIKAQASELPHKSDVGGVIVGLADEAALRDGWRTLTSNVKHHRPELVLDGVLVEAMGPRGIELVVGAKRDADWGPVLLVGLGGVWIEALKDVRLLPADLAEEDIVAQLQQLKAAPVLAGLRGAPGVDLRAVAKVVAAIGAQMRANPQIAEIDINPLVAYPSGSEQGALALDALLVARSL
jgi:acetate---CoA ligase (ADP-forming)